MRAPAAQREKAAPPPRPQRASVRSSVTRISFVDLGLLAGQVVGLVLAATGALAPPSPWLTVVGSVLWVGSQVAITVLRSPLNRALSYIGISRAIRVLILVLLAVFLELALASQAAADNLRHGSTVWLLPLAGALCFLATFADQWRALGYQGEGLAWRGLAQHGLADSEPAPDGRATAILALVCTAVLTVGIPLVLALNRPYADLVVIGAIASVTGAASCVASVVLRERLVRAGSRAERVVRLRAALESYSPEVLIFFSAPASGTYALNVWIQTVNAFTSRTVIVSKEAGHLARMEPTSVPVLFASRARDIEFLTVPTVKVVLHPTTANKVFEVMRLRGLLQVFIGHGDSDKVSSFNPYSKVFDEIWVSGPAGIDRYSALGEGFRPEQFVTVGRPQLAEIATVAADGSSDIAVPRPTVLYAPTWEGFLEQSNYSSLASMGVPMVKAMLAMPNPPRILFKPHPSSGHRRADMLAAQDEIERLLVEAGSDHQVFADGTVSLYAAFNSADVMITDISSVLTDFLASHKPYLVTNPRDEALQDFLLAFPSSAAGAIIDTDLGSQQGTAFVAAIGRALDGDPAGRPARIALADYLLGPVSADPVKSFVDEVASAVERARRRYPAPRIVPAPPASERRAPVTATAGSDAAEGAAG